MRWSGHRELWYLTHIHVGAPVIALVWASVRGAGCRCIWRDLGWTTGAGLRREFGAGLLGTIAISSLSGALIWVLGYAVRALAGASPAPDALNMVAVTEPTCKAMLLSFALIAGLVPIAEETVFRGLFYRGLRGTLNWPSAALISGIGFALGHAPWQMWPAHVISGIGYAFLREWRGSLLAPIVAHATHNAIAHALLWIMYL